MRTIFSEIFSVFSVTEQMSQIFNALWNLLGVFWKEFYYSVVCEIFNIFSVWLWTNEYSIERLVNFWCPSLLYECEKSYYNFSLPYEDLCVFSIRGLGQYLMPYELVICGFTVWAEICSIQCFMKTCVCFQYEYKGISIWYLRKSWMYAFSMWANIYSILSMLCEDLCVFSMGIRD